MISSPVVLGGQGHLPSPSPSCRGCGGLRSRHPDHRQKVSTLNPKQPGTSAARWAPAPARVRPTCCGGAARYWGSGFVRTIGTAPPSPGCPQPALPRAAPRGLSTSPSRLQPPPRPGQSPMRETATGGPPPRPAQTCLVAPPPGLVPCGCVCVGGEMDGVLSACHWDPDGGRLVCVCECDRLVRWSLRV